MTSNTYSSSSSYKTESHSIPVRSDPRTYSQREMDKVSNLERTFSNTSSTTAPTMTSGLSSNRKLAPFEDNVWDSEVTKWLNEARSRWNTQTSDIFNDHDFGFGSSTQMQKRHQNFMSSMSSRDFMHDNFANDIMAKMEERMNRDFGDMRLGSGFGTSFNQGKSNSHCTSYSKSTVSHTSTGPDGKTEIKSFSNETDSKTIDGVTTSHSTQAKDERTIPFASREMVNMNRQISEEFGSIKGNYEIGDDGKLHYKAVLNANNFLPEDLNVTTINNKLTISAKKVIQGSDGSSANKEFCRSVELPRLIDHSAFKCTLTDDGCLVIDAPVNAPDYSSITFDNENNLAIKAKNNDGKFEPTGEEKPKVLNHKETSEKHLHLEVPIPAPFIAQDIYVTTHDDELKVVAQRPDGTVPMFTRVFDLPMSVDPITISAQLYDRILVIDAPILC